MQYENFYLLDKNVVFSQMEKIYFYLIFYSFLIVLVAHSLFYFYFEERKKNVKQSEITK